MDTQIKTTNTVVALALIEKLDLLERRSHAVVQAIVPGLDSGDILRDLLDAQRAYENMPRLAAGVDPVALDYHGLAAMDKCCDILFAMRDKSGDTLDRQALLTAIETMQMRKQWRAIPNGHD